MQLAPQYLDRSLIVLDGDPAAIAAPTIGQRRRLAGLAGTFGHDELSAPSRCEGWSVLDVLAHLDGTNRFWSMSIAAARTREPSRVLAGFDPVATPAAMVEAGRDRPDAEIVAAFVDSTDRLVGDIAAVPAADWELLGEAPPGHLTLSGVAHHALWDSWVHERDILLPLGVDPVVDAAEVVAALRYAAALSPAIEMASRRRTGRVVVAGSTPAVAFTVTVGDDVTVTAGIDSGDADVTGRSVELLEAFSARSPFPAGVGADWAWLLQGLADAFDQS